MLHAGHLPCFHDDVITGGSCSSLLASSLPGGSGSNKLLAWSSQHTDVDPAQLPVNFHRSRHGRTTPSAFAGKSSSADPAESEEERREPTWPLMLISHYKSKIKEQQRIAREYALKKIIAERESFRAHDAQEYANQEAAHARQEAEAIDNGPDDSIEALQEKIMVQGPKEDAVKDEVVSSTNLLDADDRRDQAMKRQVTALQKDLEFENKLRFAMKEQQLRAERRNLIPGAVAVDCSGRQIVTKESCDAEPKTVFRDGLCLVAGGENPPDSPAELALQNADKKDTEAIEQAELDVNKQAKLIAPDQHEAKQAKINLRSAEQAVSLAKKDLAKDMASVPKVPAGKKLEDLTGAEQKKIKKAEEKLANDKAALKQKESAVVKMQKQFDQINTKLDEALKGLAAKEKKEDALRDKHIKDLKRLGDEQDRIEQEDIAATQKADGGIHDAESKMTKAQKDLAAEEGDEARILRKEADEIHERAQKADGPEQDALLAEEKKARLWQVEAEGEANASEHGDQKTVAAENVAQKNAFWGDRQKAKEVSRIGYANGESDNIESKLDPDDPQYGAKKVLEDQHNGEKKRMQELTAAQKDDTDKIRGSLKQEKEAEWSEVTGNDTKAAAQEERNSTALRETATQQKLQDELNVKKQRQQVKKTSSLSVGVSGWPFEGQKVGSTMSDDNLHANMRLIRSEAPLPLATQGIVMLSMVPQRNRKRDFRHFL